MDTSTKCRRDVFNYKTITWFFNLSATAAKIFGKSPTPTERE